MTTFGDNVYSGNMALTSALASVAPAVYNRTFQLQGSQTQTFVLPTDVQNLSGAVYIRVNGSAATSDRVTVSAAGQNLLTFASMGSAGGYLLTTTTGLGTVTYIASACSNPTTTAEVTAAVTLASVDQAASYQVQLMFSRVRNAE